MKMTKHQYALNNCILFQNSIISIEYGPELIFERNNNFYRMWNSLWASAANGELSGNNMSEFVIHNPDNSTTRVNIVQTTSGRKC